MKKIIKVVLNGFGLDIIRLPRYETLDGHLKRLLHELSIDTVLDIGANNGQFASNLRRLGFKGRILSFEPNPACFPTLSNLKAQDEMLEVFDFALGETEGVLDLNISNSNVLSSFLKINEFAKGIWGQQSETSHNLTVSIKRLDQILPGLYAKYDIKNAFCKIDTQGFDSKVIAGAGAQIERFSALLSEVSVNPIYEGMTTMSEAIDQMRAAGFEVAGFYPVAHTKEGYLIELDCLAVAKHQKPAFPAR